MFLKFMAIAKTHTRNNKRLDHAFLFQKIILCNNHYRVFLFCLLFSFIFFIFNSYTCRAFISKINI